MLQSLFGYDLNALQSIAEKLNLGQSAAVKMYKYIYNAGVSSINDMVTISAKKRNLLKRYYTTDIVPFSDVQVSVDGTKKYLFDYGDFRLVEAAYIPEDNRATLCISSQVGCKMGCSFCMTARQGFQANLTVAEILNQIAAIPERDKITNIVFMGMGEPFDNADNVFKAIDIIIHQQGFGIAPGKVTVSTIGIIPGINRLFAETKCNLAISLHNPFSHERKQIMPVENRYKLNDTMDIITGLSLKEQQRVFFEYILFDGVNDSQDHILELSKLLNNMSCKVNVIRFHPIPGSDLKSPDEDNVIKFMRDLNSKGVVATVRKSRGQDIFAACGLLSTQKKANP